VLLAAVTAAGFALRFGIFGDSPFADELSTYWIVSDYGLTGTWDVVHTDAEITPPLYFLLSELATKIDLTPEMSRLPSLLAGTATIPLVFLIGDRTVGRRAALVAAALVALSPFMTYYSAEARGYQVMIFCALVSTLALLFLAEGRSRRWWVVYALAAAGAMYTHYTAAFWLLAAFGWLVWARPDLWRDALLANVGAAILFAPWISGVLADFDSPTTEILSQLEPFTLDFVSTALAHWAIGFPYSVIGLDQLPGTLGLVLIMLALVMAAVGLWLRFRDGRPQLDPRIVLVAALALAAPLGEALFSAVSTDLLGTRNLAVSWPGLALLVAAFVTAAPRRLWIAPTALLLTAFAIAAVKMQGSDFERPKFEAAAEFVDAEAGPGDVVIDAAVFSPGPMSALDVWLDEEHRILRAGQPQQDNHPFNAFDRVLTPAEITRMAAREAQGGRIVIVTNRVQANDYGPQVDQILRLLPPRYERVSEEYYPAVVTLGTIVLEDRGVSAASPG